MIIKCGCMKGCSGQCRCIKLINILGVCGMDSLFLIVELALSVYTLSR